MGDMWAVGLAATALVAAVIAVAEKARNRPERKPGTDARSAPRRGEGESWAAGGAVAGCGASAPGRGASHDTDSSCDGSSSSCGDGGGGCGGCGCGG